MGASNPGIPAFRGNGSPIGLVGSFPSTAELLSFFSVTGPLANGATFVTSGRVTAGDGGGATFRYEALDTMTADNGGTVRVDTVGRRWHATSIRDYVSVRIFGAIADGITDCSVSIAAANSWNNPGGPSGCLLPAGNYVIAQDITLPNRLQGAGGVLLISAAKTVTLNAPPRGPLTQMFGGSGVVVAGNVSAVGYPEWFGAKVDNASFDCLAAINACVAAFPITQFQRAGYYFSNTLQFTTSGRRIQGFSTRNPLDTGTTLVITNGTSDVILVGAVTDPGSINRYTHNIDIYGLYAGRSVPVVPLATDTVAAISSWRVQYGLNIYMDTCVGDNSSHGFTYWNVVESYFNRLEGRRTAPGVGSNPDIFDGHFLNGFGPTYMASCYFTQCSTDYNTTGCINPQGITVVGSATDIYIDQFEADDIEYGFYYNGTGATKPSIDFYMRGCVLDETPGWGIYLTAVPAGSNMYFGHNYIAPQAGGASCIAVVNCHGAITFAGNEGIGLGTSGAGKVVGISISGSSGISCDSNMWTDLYAGVVVNSSFACQIKDTVMNNLYGGGGTCIEVGSNSASLFIQPTIYANSVGVAVDLSCSAIEVNTSAISSVHTKGKLYYNGGHVTSNGLFGVNNLASGILT